MPSIPSPLKEELEHINKVLKEIFAESDRSGAVLAVAELDIQLKKNLEKLLLPAAKKSVSLLETDGPLGDFGARVELIYRVGLIPELWHQELHILRKIRNAFGHVGAGLDFTQPPVCDLVRNLTVGLEILDSSLRTRETTTKTKVPRLPQAIFRMSCSYMLPQMVLLRYNVPQMKPLWPRFVKPPEAAKSIPSESPLKESGEG